MSFPREKIGKVGIWEKLQIPNFSDGERKHWPTNNNLYVPGSDENYLIHLGQAFEQHPQKDVQYYIDRLPDGYAVFVTSQRGGGQMYKRLFGHPKGKFYDSIQKFRTHFLWLMSGMDGDCDCVLCVKKKPLMVSRPKPPKDPNAPPIVRRPRAPREVFYNSNDDSESANGIASRRARRDARLSSGPYAVDEEGTEDVYKNFIKRLHTSQDSKHGIDDDIREDNSLDWCAEHRETEADGLNLMTVRIRQIDLQPSFLPRIGEVVLWCTNLHKSQQLVFEEKSERYMIYSRKKHATIGVPTWRAGVVTSTPPAWDLENGPIDYHDIDDLPAKKTALNIAGYRVETLPDPNNSAEKSASKQYKLLPLRSIRPLSQWHMLTRGVPLSQQHPSIMHALTCSTSISLMEKFKATGSWPKCTIHCKGIYLGPELIMVGDTVRISSLKTATVCQEVLRVESIRLNLENIQNEHAQRDSPGLSSQSWISFVGKAYTSDPAQGYGFVQQANGSPVPVPLTEIQSVLKGVGNHECGSWFYLHNFKKKYLISHEQVLGRLHEPAAVRLWTHRSSKSKVSTPSEVQKPLLDYDVPGIIMARRIATRTDRRLPDPQASQVLWYWADTRAEALAVESFNGHEVGKYWHVREKETLESWHTQMRIINGDPYTPKEASMYVPSSTITGSTRGRKPGTKVINGKLVYPGDPEYEAAKAEPAMPKASSQMAGAAFVSSDEDTGDSVEELGDSEDPRVNIDKRKAAEGSSGAQLYQGSYQDLGERSIERPEGALQPVKTPKPMLSKTQIMAGVEEPTIESDSEDEWLKPVGLARGGTDESSGGDYHDEAGPESPWS